MRRLTKYLRPYRFQCILGPAAKLVEAVFELIVPLVMARIIDVGIATGDKGYVVRMSLVLVLDVVCNMVTGQPELVNPFTHLTVTSIVYFCALMYFKRKHGG